MEQNNEKTFNKILHLRSAEINGEGAPLLPSPDKLEHGEIAINYHQGVETLVIKNDSGETKTFKTDDHYEKIHGDIQADVEAVDAKVENLDQRVTDEGKVTTDALTSLDERLDVVEEEYATEEFVQQRFFVGTIEEYNTAWANGEIAVGALVIILDDELNEDNGENDNNSDATSSILGKGVLGQMVLG